jgi:hypothetical protein
MKLAILAVLVVAACGGAAMQTISLSNQTPRTIKELYVYPVGSKDRGKSRGSLAPSAGTNIQMPTGNVEVYAVSEMVKIDDHTRDVPTVTQALELTQPLQVIFYDGSDKPAAANGPGVIGVSFILAAKKPPPLDDAPAP